MQLEALVRSAVGALVALAAATPSLAAQQASGPASLSGFAYDSVRGHAMTHAQIVVRGTTLIAVADTIGYFHFDSIPSGKFRLLAVHPVLDSLGIQLLSPELTATAGQHITMNMATPSGANLVKQLCAAAWLNRGPAALFGRVRNADTGQPIPNAHVSIVWTDILLNGLQKIPRIRAANTTDDGTYRICGLPSDMDGKVQVAYSGLTSGDVPVTFNHELLEMRSLSLASAAPVAVAKGDTTPPEPRRALAAARLTGKVYSVTGVPVSNARIQVEGTARATTSRSDGSFALDSLPSGSQVLIARQIGYNPVEQPVELSAATPATAVLRFDQAVTLLPTVTTVAKVETGLDNVGFSNREKMGMGTFLNTTQLDQRHATTFTDILRGVPGLRVQTSGSDTQVSDPRSPGGSGCVIFVVDGSPWVSMSPGDIDSFLIPSNVGAIEVYHGVETPPEFVQPSQSGCGVVVVWTKWRLERNKKK